MRLVQTVTRHHFHWGYSGIPDYKYFHESRFEILYPISQCVELFLSMCCVCELCKRWAIVLEICTLPCDAHQIDGGAVVRNLQNP